MFHILLLVVASFFAGMMVFAGWEAWLAYRVYLTGEEEYVPKAYGEVPRFPAPVVPGDTRAAQVKAAEKTATPEPPVREVDEEVLAAIAAADHYLDESELDDLFGPSTEG